MQKRLRNPREARLPKRLMRDVGQEADMKRTALIILVAVACSGCASFSNVTTHPIRHKLFSDFVVIADQVGSAMGGFTSVGMKDRKGNLTIITPSLNMGCVYRAYVAPGGNRILLLARGEGHQYVALFATDDLAKACLQLPEETKPLNTIDPPYYLEQIRWESEDVLSFWAYSDFTKFDREIRRSAYSPDSDDKVLRRWRWYVDEDRFEEVPNKPPGAYFKRSNTTF